MKQIDKLTYLAK